jgi:2-succinyl-5-enolpyruvyl-6-hydroxy-3-cyclohexene-1-carboxylate synthase
MPVTATIAACLAAGVREFCVCAGSRNSELVRCLVAGGYRLWHFFEERSAAFFALGRVRVTDAPVAVVTTSGTAAAELFPAIIEAHYQGLPLLAVTADRPRHYRGSGAPQAIEQVRLFGDYPTHQVDVATSAEASQSLAEWTQTGPAHLNVCLEEPGNIVLNPPAILDLKTDPPPLKAATIAVSTEGLLVLLGELLPREQSIVRNLLGNYHGPVWAEAASGLRGWLGDRLITGGDAALKKISYQQILRLGGVPSCRLWRDLESQPEVSVISASRSGHSGLARPSHVVRLEEILPLHGGKPISAIQLDALLTQFPTSECGHLRCLSEQIPAESGLFLGNSLSIREWNLAARPGGAEAHCHVMRGANGIDGNASFFYGISAAYEESWAVVGDLTALYDLAAPWILGQLPPGRRRYVIMNNGGGMIFRRLPSLHGMADAERQVIENSHRISFAPFAQLWGMEYVSIRTHSDWQQPLPEGDVVIEILPDEAASEAFWNALPAFVAAS